MLTFDNSQKITVYYISSLSRLKTIHVPSAFSLLNKFGSNVCRFSGMKIGMPKGFPRAPLFCDLIFISDLFLNIVQETQWEIHHQSCLRILWQMGICPCVSYERRKMQRNNSHKQIYLHTINKNKGSQMFISQEQLGQASPTSWYFLGGGFNPDFTTVISS